MNEATDRQHYADVVADIAALARKLAETAPYKSASGPDALRAFAGHLDGMLAELSADPMPAVQVAFRKKRVR